MNKPRRSLKERFLNMLSADFHQYEVEETEYKRPKRVLVNKWVDLIYKIGSVMITIIFIAFLLYAVGHSPEFGQADNPAMNEVAARYIVRGPDETGAANTIAGMILDYRAFDTFGESLMMFTAAMAVISVLKNSFNEGGKEDEVH